MYASIPDKIQQEIISKEGYVLIFYHIVYLTWWISRIQYDRFFVLETLLTAFSVVDLMVNINQW